MGVPERQDIAVDGTLQLRAFIDSGCGPQQPPKLAKPVGVPTTEFRSICRLHSQRGKCKPQSQGKCLRQEAKHCHCRPKSRGGSCHQIVSRHRCLLTPSWEPKLFLGTHDLEPVPLEECMAHLRPSLYHCRHSWYISTVALISIPLPRLSEQVSHNKP